MTTRLLLEGCEIKSGDFVRQMVIKFRNAGDRACGPGGVRFVVSDGNGLSERISAAHLWPLPAGAVANVIGPMAGSFAVQSIGEFAYVELSGDVHPLLGTVSITLMRGIRVEHKV